MKFISFIIIFLMLALIIYQNGENKKSIQNLSKRIDKIEAQDTIISSTLIKKSCNKAEDYIREGNNKKALAEIKKIKEMSESDSSDIIDSLKDNLDSLVKEKLSDYIK